MTKVYAVFGQDADPLARIVADSADEAVTHYNKTKRRGAPWGKAALIVNNVMEA